MAGLEVESIESHAETLAKFIVGEVRKITRHPNADRLTVCTVYNGKSEVQVVCGAPNVREGQKIAFAPVGAVVPRNQHDPGGTSFSIGSVKIRGVLSSGMICSGYELGISDDTEGILVLDSTAEPGESLAEHLGLDDSIFEIGVTANRPDLLSHIGISREISAITGKSCKKPDSKPREGSKSVRSVLSVEIDDPVGCPRYTARVIFDVSVAPSPKWLQEVLTSLNIRPVNNIVDITNYVLMETGHPLHAFDYDRIEGRKIVVRRPRDENKFLTLDQKSRDLDGDTLLICDSIKPIAVAGVMGGANSEISNSTTKIVLESAYFNPVRIRKASKLLGISTEASQRFERGADPELTLYAIDRAARLVAEIAGGTVLKGRIDRYLKKIKAKKVRLHTENCNKLLDVTLQDRTISGLLGSINIKKISSGTRGSADYLIPTWRPDITREVDLIEEVARLYGYDNIKSSNRVGFSLGEVPPRSDLTDMLRDYLAAVGYHEVINNSMQDLPTASLAGVLPVEITNPISRDMTAMRTHLLPGMLTTIKHNIYHSLQSSRFYEIGTVFERKESRDTESLDSYYEEERLILAAYGNSLPTFWGDTDKIVDIFTLKGEAKVLFDKFSLDNPRYIPYSTPTALTERSIFIEINEKRAGVVGMVSKALLKRYDIETDVVFLDLSVDKIKKLYSREVRYQPYPRYPAVQRDIAVIVDETVAAGRIEEEIRAAAGSMLCSLVLFDIYRGEQIGKGKKSCAFSLEFQSADHTFEQHEIQSVMDGVTGRLGKSLNAVLRQKEIQS